MSADDDRALSIVEPPTDTTPTLLPEELARARRYAAASKAESTRDKYERAWSDFRAWCHARGHEPLPAHPVVVAAYLSFEADRGMSPSAIQVKLAAVAWVHKRAGRQPPQRTEQGVAISDVMSGIRRSHGKPPNRKAAADGDIMRDVIQAIQGDGLREVRDRALLAFGMASAMRRSELVALDMADIARGLRGLRVTIRRSKTDQEGKGVTIAVPEGRRLRPVARLQEWIERAGIADGPLFRRLSNAGDQVLSEPMSDRSVARVVQARVVAVGLDPKDFAGHSLRAGFLTSAARAGASIFKMREVSRHKTVQVLADYVRDAKIFDDHAGEGFI
ncbi:MAG: integrase [Azospirillum brasilense]|nr:MAG: integrase [Azospirillum brasilense]PZR08556.1 MAG: integrase [Azospirillum brasilense]